MDSTLENKVKLTDAVVARAALPPGRADYIIWDTEARGFGLRVRPSSKSFILYYRPPGAGRSSAPKRMKLGTPQTIKTATEARAIAFQYLGDIARGKDPAADRSEQKRREKAKISDLLDRYEKHLTARNYVARKMVMSLLRTRLAGHLDKDVKELRGADLAAITERLEAQGLNGAADAFRARCRAFLSWCLTSAKVIDENPSFGQRKQRMTRADKLKVGRKARALSDDDLKKVWIAADPGTVFGRLVRFLILSGCRRAEAAAATRAWVVARDEAQSIVFPAEVMKQGAAFELPISKPLEALLAECKEDSRSKLFFPSSRTGGQISGWTKFVDKLKKTSGVDFKLHDLRRTMRTGLSALGVSTDIAELCIAHARPGIERVYNHDQAEAAKREALELWGSFVSRAVLTKN